MITHPMSNDDLAEAITAAYNRAGEATEDQRMQKRHLEALLEIQRHRAALTIIDGAPTGGAEIAT